MTTDISPTGDLLVTSILAGGMHFVACSNAPASDAGIAHHQLPLTRKGNKSCVANFFGKFARFVMERASLNEP